MSRTALCSTCVVTRWRPLEAYISIAPFSARLIDSGEPEVNTISLGEAPIREATCLRAFSTASSAFQP